MSIQWGWVEPGGQELILILVLQEDGPKMPEAEESVKPPPTKKKRVAHVAKFEVN